MNIDPLTITGSWVCTPTVRPDERGTFLEWFRADLLERATGRHFDVLQANHSISRQGVVRGVHFAAVPPGQAKFVYCPRGSALDLVVDLRVGSPTFGRHEAVAIDDVNRRAVFVAEGLGHAFCALADDTSVTYLLSSRYDPSAEHAITPFDPALALPWPEPAAASLVSPRDIEAPSLADAERLGLLPTYAACQARYDALRH